MPPPGDRSRQASTRSRGERLGSRSVPSGVRFLELPERGTPGRRRPNGVGLYPSLYKPVHVQGRPLDRTEFACASPQVNTQNMVNIWAAHHGGPVHVQVLYRGTYLPPVSRIMRPRPARPMSTSGVRLRRWVHRAEPERLGGVELARVPAWWPLRCRHGCGPYPRRSGRGVGFAGHAAAQTETPRPLGAGVLVGWLTLHLSCGRGCNRPD